MMPLSAGLLFFALFMFIWGGWERSYSDRERGLLIQVVAALLAFVAIGTLAH